MAFPLPRLKFRVFFRRLEVSRSFVSLFGRIFGSPVEENRSVFGLEVAVVTNSCADSLSVSLCAWNVRSVTDRDPVGREQLKLEQRNRGGRRGLPPSR